MKRLNILLLLLVLSAAGVAVDSWRRGAARAAGASVVDAGGLNQPMILLSRAYRLDRIFKSMEGPASPHPSLRLPSNPAADFVWLTGVETEAVDARTLEPISSEFLCHTNLTFDPGKEEPEKHNEFFKGQTHLEWRLFSMIPGRFSIRLPEGFGIPIPNHAALDYYTMSLNQNERDRVIETRARTKIYSVPSNEVAKPMKALFRRALYILQPQDGSVAKTMNEPQHVGAGCAATCSLNASAVPSVGPIGQGQTTHWMVPPGKHIYQTDVTPQLDLPFDTTIHYATFHIHHYGKSVQFRDLTTGETVLKLTSRDRKDRLGVEHADQVKSKAGIPIVQSHRYEMTIEYDNTSNAPIDAMGMLYLYCHEKEFDPAKFRPAQAAPSIAAIP